MFPLTPWVKRLLIANVVAFFVTYASPPLYQLLTLYPTVVLFRPWTIVTYMFLHAGFTHILFNMIGLFVFGPRVENRLGSRGFLLLYFLSGVGGAAFSILFARGVGVVGASAAVYGVMLGYALYWPRQQLWIWGVLPVEAWILVAFIVFASLWSGMTGSGGRTAHFAHLGGFAIAFVFLKWWDWRKGAALRSFQRQLNPNASRPGPGNHRATLTRWRSIRLDHLHELNRGEVQRLLAKAEKEGPSGLSQPERDFLDRMSGG